MDIWALRNTDEYQEVIAVSLAEADIELAKAANSHDLSSADSGLLFLANERLKRAQAEIRSLETLISNMD